jgi:predicted DNA-binding transcriptional regulator AlpA
MFQAVNVHALIHKRLQREPVAATVKGVGPAERELITAAAIARLAGVGRAAVSNWRKRYPEFPKPAGGSPNSPAFDRAEVLTWLKETGKADQLSTAGRTDGGTIRIGAASAYTVNESFGRTFEAGLAEELKRLPMRSISDLLPGDLLARTMAALLPRSIAPDRTDDDDEDEDAGPDRSYEQDRTLAGSWPYRSGVNDEVPVVIDPACGAAAALMAVADRFGARIRLAGQDVDEKVARIAAFNLSGDSHRPPYEVHAGDSFTDNQLGAYLGKASAVVCEPPFDRPDWPIAELTTDRRWEFGIPAPRDAELAWVQHCYAHLRPNGVAVVAMSQRTCVQLSGEHIRAALVRTGALRAVIALPKGLGSLPGADICLWVLRRPVGAPDRSPVRMINLSALGDPADVPLEFGAWQQFFDGGDPAFTRAVERLELLDEGACLLPSRYLAPHREAPAADLVRVTERLADLYAAVGRGLPRFTAPKTASRHARVTLAELERAGALMIRARDDTPRVGDVLLRTRGRPPVVATAERDSDQDAIGRFVDVGGIAQVVEIDGTRLDPYFVALFLRTDGAALPVANTLGAINRDDLRRCRIPRLPLAEQRRYGEAFRRLSELEQALATLSDLSAKVIEQTIFALTAGGVAPEYELPAAGRVYGRDTDEMKERRQ